jgi:hypothetical protein
MTIDGALYTTFGLKVFNDSTVPVCIAVGYPQTSVSENSIFPLCLSSHDSIYTANLMIPEIICNIDVENFPVTPVVLYPNSYLSTNIALKIKPDIKKIFLFIPYQDQQISFSSITKYYSEKRGFFQLPFYKFNYKKILLPD